VDIVRVVGSVARVKRGKVLGYYKNRSQWGKREPTHHGVFFFPRPAGLHTATPLSSNEPL
jgi:hypothetical protein